MDNLSELPVVQAALCGTRVTASPPLLWAAVATGDAGESYHPSECHIRNTHRIIFYSEETEDFNLCPHRVSSGQLCWNWRKLSHTPCPGPPPGKQESSRQGKPPTERVCLHAHKVNTKVHQNACRAHVKTFMSNFPQGQKFKIIYSFAKLLSFWYLRSMCLILVVGFLFQ